MNNIYGKYIKELREAHGYSLRTFAKKIYVSKSSVQRWEQSFLPENEEVFQAISNLFSLSVEEMRQQSLLLYEKDKISGTMPQYIEENGDIAEETEEDLGFFGNASLLKKTAIIGGFCIYLATIIMLILYLFG